MRSAIMGIAARRDRTASHSSTSTSFPRLPCQHHALHASIKPIAKLVMRVSRSRAGQQGRFAAAHATVTLPQRRLWPAHRCLWSHPFLLSLQKALARTARRRWDAHESQESFIR